MYQEGKSRKICWPAKTGPNHANVSHDVRYISGETASATILSGTLKPEKKKVKSSDLSLSPISRLFLAILTRQAGYVRYQQYAAKL